MVTEELLDYVRTQRQEGVSEQAIREALLSVGWTQEDAEQALGLTAPETPASAVPNNPPDLERPVEEASQMGEEPQIKAEETGQETPQNEQPSQQEDDLVSFKPADQPSQAPTEEAEPAPLEEEAVVDNKPQGEILEALPEGGEDTGPIELNDQGQIIKGPQSPSAVESQQNTEVSGGLGANVSSSQPQVETNPSVSQEPVFQQPTASPIRDSGEEQPSSGQEQNSQVAVDPKAK